MVEWPEIKELKSKIIGMEMEMSLIEKDLKAFQRELNNHQSLLIQIEENISFLKKSKAIVSLLEFKKINQQKKLVEKRIIYYKNKILPLQSAMETKIKCHHIEMEKFKILYKSQFKNNVLEFDCGRRAKEA